MWTIRSTASWGRLASNSECMVPDVAGSGMRAVSGERRVKQKSAVARFQSAKSGTLKYVQRTKSAKASQHF